MNATPRPAPTLPPARLPRGPFVMLGAMTTTTILGPFLIGFVLKGGVSPIWPPDRPIEWATVLGISGAVLGLMGACLALVRTTRRVIATAHVPDANVPLPASSEVQP